MLRVEQRHPGAGKFFYEFQHRLGIQSDMLRQKILDARDRLHKRIIILRDLLAVDGIAFDDMLF